MNKNVQEARNGFCALAFAIQSGDIALIEYLVTQAEVDVECRDRLGRTCLLLVGRVRLDISEFLIIEGKANINAKDNKGETILMRALRQKQDALITLLLKQPSLEIPEGHPEIQARFVCQNE